jgi:hypothetical protein
MQRKRLEKLREFIKSVPNSRFRMRTWCGTSQCLGGWAACMPEFNKKGLCHVQVDSIRNYTLPFFKDNYDQYALEKFFGLSRLESDFLFYGDIESFGAAGKRKAIARINEVLANDFRRFIL